MDKEVCSWDVYSGLELKGEESDAVTESNTGVAESCNQRQTLLPGRECDRSKYSAKETLVMVFHTLHIDAAVLSGIW